MRLTIQALVALTVSTCSLVHAQQPAWAQCGGAGWTGKTSCVSGHVCHAQNAYYSQCIPGVASSSRTSSSKTFTTSVKSSTSVAVSTSSTKPPTSTSASTPPNPNPSSTKPKYLISFGDSYSQTGFSPLLSLPSPSNPLGNPTFPGWTTSGGPNWIGYTVSEFNTSGPVYSYNFASGGATTDAKLVKPFADTVLSFVDQVNLFLKSAKEPGFVQWNAENAVFAVWIGVNDVGNAWSLPAYPTTLLASIMDQYMNQTQTLYDSAGAREFLFLTVPPIQYTPTVQSQGAETVAAEAKAVVQYNEALAKRVEGFVKKNEGARVRVVDTGVPFMQAINDPGAVGAEDAGCFDESGVRCLWWNDYHPGLAIHRLVAKAVSVAVGGW